MDSLLWTVVIVQKASPAARPLSSAPIILKIRAMWSQVPQKNHRKRDNTHRPALQRRHGERTAQRSASAPAFGPWMPCPCPALPPGFSPVATIKGGRGQREEEEKKPRGKASQSWQCSARIKLSLKAGRGARRPKKESLAASQPAAACQAANANAASAAARCALCRGRRRGGWPLLTGIFFQALPRHYPYRLLGCTCPELMAMAWRFPLTAKELKTRACMASKRVRRASNAGFYR